MSLFTQKATQAIKAKADKIHNVVVDKGLQIAKRNTPVDTGYLRSTVREIKIGRFTSIIHWGDNKTKKRGGGIGYEFYVSRGTKRQASQPFDILSARQLVDSMKISFGGRAKVVTNVRNTFIGK